MKPATKRELNIALSRFVEQVLRNPTELGAVDAIAEACGYSKYHLSRVFVDLTGESLMGFVRRIRLERSAYRLLSGISVSDAATAGGFESPEAYSRAFKRAFSLGPREFRRAKLSWHIPSPENLHWNELWDEETPLNGLRTRYPTKLEMSPGIRLAVMEHLGNYSRLAEGWEKVPCEPDRRWVTVYYDNMWTSPRRDMMRAGLGFVCPIGPIPAGFRAVEIPAGLTLRTADFVDRPMRNEAWSYVAGTWPNRAWAWDEYAAWPLPFDEVKTRICIRLNR